jgi:hypothetical protein
MTTTATRHRRYAKVSMEALVEELGRLELRGSAFTATLLANPNRTGRWCAVQTLVEYTVRVEQQQDYLALADEFNDGTPAELGITLADFTAEAVANAAAYAADHGLSWPPAVGDYDEAIYRVELLDEAR